MTSEKIQLKRLYILTNSPGELSNWVTPLTHTASKLIPNLKIEIFLTPCPYATGNEYNYAKSLPGVTKVHEPKQTIKRLLSPKISLKKQKDLAVLYLGGDPFYAKLLSWKNRCSVFAYSERSLAGFKQCFCRDEMGDLMYSSLDIIKKSKEESLSYYQMEDKPYCIFIAGSRLPHAQALIPHYVKILKNIKKTNPDFPALLVISPFITDQQLAKILEPEDATGFVIRKGESKELFQLGKFAVTIPGTNTAELAYLGIPMALFLPLHDTSVIPLDGLLGILTNLPMIGPKIRNLIIQQLKKRPWFALPNIMSNTKMVPEHVGLSDPEKTAQIILNYYTDKDFLEAQQRALKTLVPKYDVSKKIIESIASISH